MLLIKLLTYQVQDSYYPLFLSSEWKLSIERTGKITVVMVGLWGQVMKNHGKSLQVTALKAQGVDMDVIWNFLWEFLLDHFSKSEFSWPQAVLRTAWNKFQQGGSSLFYGALWFFDICSPFRMVKTKGIVIKGWVSEHLKWHSFFIFTEKRRLSSWRISPFPEYI